MMSQGNLFITDYLNFRIRRVDAQTQIITTVAGNGTGGYNGDNIPAISAGADLLRNHGDRGSVEQSLHRGRFRQQPIHRVDGKTQG